MPGYGQVIQSHAKRAMLLYKAKADELCRLSGFNIAADGSNNASTKEDALRYLKALEAVGGMVAVSAAKLTLKQVARENGLDDDF